MKLGEKAIRRILYAILFGIPLALAGLFAIVAILWVTCYMMSPRPYYTCALPDDTTSVLHQKDFKLPELENTPKYKARYLGAFDEAMLRGSFYEAWICEFDKKPTKSFYRELERLSCDSTSRWQESVDSTVTTYQYDYPGQKGDGSYKRLLIRKGSKYFRAKICFGY